MLAGCGGAQPPIGAPGAVAHRVVRGPSSYQVLYTWQNLKEGGYPLAGLVRVNDRLYGTTFYGGLFSDFTGYGTVYSTTTAGSVTVLKRFTSHRGGHAPYAGLIAVNGALYGTTKVGGESRWGTVYRITTTGRITYLHDFAGVPNDGALPEANLIDVNGTMFGTTTQGGNSGCYHYQGCGTVFSITAAGVETVLHKFVAGSDGVWPTAALTDVNGMLYGTTAEGGGAGCNGVGCGTVYRISPSGSEQIIYRFAGGKDGSWPQAALLNVNGTLYGTTAYGGTNNGTVFSINRAGKLKHIYDFAGGSDGSQPVASLIDVNGTLYGTTVYGGISGCSGFGCGTVFSITTAGVETVVHAFSYEDGVWPQAPLLNINGTLYGTTSAGGSGSCVPQCNGTVFALTP
jgi:uncharacterized repeat protein (TIGR03803 family)